MSNQIVIGVESKMFDNFALDCYRNCPQFYDWRIHRGIVRPGAKKTAADFGTAIHLALEHYYKNGMSDQSISEAINLFAESFSDKQDITDEKRTLAKGLDILSKYFTKYRHEPFNVITTEVGGAMELGEYLYTFRIDLATEWYSPRGVYGWDHKTTSSLGRLVVKPNNQFTGYMAALSETYENLLGFMVNMIGVYKTDKTKDKSTGKMIEREILVRTPTARTRKEIEDWKIETIHLIHEIENCQMKDVWPKHTNFCTAYSSKCMYLDLCTSQDKDIIIPLLEAEVYLKQPWTPYVGADEVEGGEEG